MCFHSRAMTDPEQLAGGVIVGGFDGTSLPDVIRDRLARGHLAGVTLFKRNIVDVFQVRTLCADLTSAAHDGIGPVISIDQEGGRVARLRESVTVLPAMRLFGKIDDPDLTRRAALAVGAELSALGINLNFAPVCDVDSNPANPVIGDRAFGRDPATVIRHATAFIEGLREAGVMGCAKHFPGHGDTETDSHFELPRIRHDRARLDSIELPPFRAAVRAGVASVMSAHVLFDALDAAVPATLSRAAMTELLREDVCAGHDGVVIVSDDLHMKAVSARWGVESAAVEAIRAGCDALLICVDPDSQERVRLALARAACEDEGFAKRLAEAQDRVTRMRQSCPPRPVADESALREVLSRASHRALLEEITRRTG